MDLKGKKVLVVGSGLSGIGAVELLEQVGAQPVLFEGNQAATEEQIRNKLTAGSDVPVFIGVVPAVVMAALELVVLSPGVPIDQPFVTEMAARGIPVWGELELAYYSGKGRVLAITGTNGKTTTTTLLGQIAKAYQKDVYVVGNIGIPYTKAALEMTDHSLVIAEVSSFQLETTHSFHPVVSAILNITPDHLDRHHTLAEYIRVKEMITQNQTEKDVCVLNYEDEVLRKFGENLTVGVLFFSSQRTLERGVYLQDGIIYLQLDDAGKAPEEVCRLSELKVLGIHNYENIMAAIGMAASAFIPLPTIRLAVTNFMGVEHRIEYVTEKAGVRYYNDSKGTNPDAAIKGIQAMDRPTWLIGGGYDKQSSYDEWIQSFDGKVKQLVLIGQTREKIADTAHRYGFMNTIFADTLEEAVQICAGQAEPGDAVLLSPACASWGMFENYEVRGEMFKEYVKNL